MLVKRLSIIKNNLEQITIKEFFVRFLFVYIGSTLIYELTHYFSEKVKFEFWTEKSIYYILFIWYAFWGVNRIVQYLEENIHSSPSYSLTSISKFLFSLKNNQEIFQPIIADWHEEYFEALFKKETWKARWINVRYTYAFLGAMWQKSPIGDLIEFISKMAK